MVENFTAHITPFGLDRNTFVYLPDDWQSSGRRYPVVYMFDGHNLFFDSTATYGTCWGLKEYMDAHPQAIIVAPECNHEGNARLEEYSPYDFVWQEYDIKGRGKAYLDWMVQELKPLIDAKYPTLPDRENTAIGGSSMGGLMSLYGVTAHNETFSRAACLSPSVRFSFTEVKADIKKFVKFHLNQGLVVLALATVCACVGFLPHGSELGLALTLLVDVLSLVGLVQTLRGLKSPLPGIWRITRAFHPFN